MAASPVNSSVVLPDPRPADLVTVMQESFVDNRNDWVTGPLEKGAEFWITSTAEIRQGVYRIEGRAQQDVVWWIHPDIQELQDFYLSVDLRQVSGPANAELGVVFRIGRNGYYAFTIAPGVQEYALDLWDAGQWIELIDWTYTSALASAGWNTIQVRASGSNFSFWINRWHVADIQDNTLPEGKVGVTIGFFQPGDEGAFEFDNFIVETPPR